MNIRYGLKHAGIMIMAVMLLAFPIIGQAAAKKAVATGMADVYAKAKATSKVVGQLNKGDYVTIKGVSGKLAKVSFDGRTGYVMRTSLQLSNAAPAPNAPKTAQTKAKQAEITQEATTASARTLKTTVRTKAYAQADENSASKIVSAGTKFSILGESGAFYKVMRGKAVAYINKTAFDKTSAKKEVQSAQKNQADQKASSNQKKQTVKTLEKDVTMYARASKSSKSMGELAAGTQVTVLKKNKNVVKVSFNGRIGFVDMSAFASGGNKTAPAKTTTKSQNEPDRAKADKVVAAGVAQVGKPYVFGSEGMNSFDCSGLTRFAYKQVGITLPHSAQAVGYTAGTKVERADLKKGDIVCFNTIADADRSDHVGIYMGSNQFVHASSGQSRVTISTLTNYYNDNFSWGRRVL